LTEIWSVWERLWPKRPSDHPSLRKKRPVLTMIHGGEDDESDTAGV